MQGTVILTALISMYISSQAVHLDLMWGQAFLLPALLIQIRLLRDRDYSKWSEAFLVLCVSTIMTVVCEVLLVVEAVTD